MESDDIILSPHQGCTFATMEKIEMEHHWETVQHQRPLAITSNDTHWSKMMFQGLTTTTPPPPEANKVTKEEIMLWDFVESCKTMALTVYDNVSPQLPDGWAEDERLWDILDVIGFAFDYQLPNSGVERMINMMRELSGGSSARINALPLSWKTLVKEAMVGVDTSNLATYKLKVPEGLPVNFKEIPFILKSTKAIMQELLFDVRTMDHGDFFFRYPQSPGNYRFPLSNQSTMPMV